MSNFIIFIVGLAVTLVCGLGVITSQVFLGYDKFMRHDDPKSKETYAINKPV